MTDTLKIPRSKTFLLARGGPRSRKKHDVDIHSAELRVVIEYDGWFYHGPSRLFTVTEHEAVIASDRDKAEDLRQQGYTVIRARQGTPKLHRDDVTFPKNAPIATVANLIVKRLIQRGKLPAGTRIHANVDATIQDLDIAA